MLFPKHTHTDEVYLYLHYFFKDKMPDTPHDFQGSYVRKSNPHCEEEGMSMEVNASEPSVPSKLILCRIQP